jgi:Bifunctional DNA primase/polymerase, N-terminal
MSTTYTTCRDCGGLLWATNNDTVHPLCTPKPTKVERLAEQWLEAVEAGDAAREAELQSAINELDNRPPRLREAALLYASWGWPVFPLSVRGKMPLLRNIHKDDPPDTPRCRGECGQEGHGLYDATADTATITRWWTNQPRANIGLPTGHAFDVIDVDVPKKGQPIPGAIALAELHRLDVIPDSHGQVATGSGGLHIYITATGDGNKAGIRPGVDYRGLGGYVVAPPSTLGRPGRSWSWIHKPSPVITAAAG